jgi:metal-sulfur cluster biosynthetic enzyme
VELAKLQALQELQLPELAVAVVRLVLVQRLELEEPAVAEKGREATGRTQELDEMLELES